MKNYPGFYYAIMAIILIVTPFAHSVSAQDDEQGKIIAKIDFDPESDGFGFRNYGVREEDDDADLDVGDMIEMFGANNVCIEGSTEEDCVLYEAADKWREQQLRSMDGGHCDGFSVTTLRNWLNEPFRGKAEPKQWQPDAEVNSDLKFDDTLSNYIAHYHILQSLKEVYTFREKTFSIPPTGIVKLLIDSFKNGNEYYTLGIGMRVNGKYTKGHSIVPFAIEDMGGKIYRIHVYDNNFPGQTKYVTVDGNNESWRYRTASDPNKKANDYFGDRSTKTLSLKRLSDRNLKKYQCPFCGQTKSEGSSEGSADGSSDNSENITFAFNGEGSLLITDPNGKKIGFNGTSEINQVPGAEIVYNDGGLDLDYSPEYALPYHENAKNNYEILISGKGLQKEVNADLEITAPGFVVGLEGVLLDPNETLKVTVSPDGETITFTASADGETPTIYVTTADGPDSPSYSFEVGGVSIEAGKSLTMTADIEEGKVFFKDNDGNEDNYDVKMTRLNPDGTENDFEEDDLDIGNGDKYEMDFGKWDGKGKMEFKEDKDGDGFDDETPVGLANEAKPKPKKVKP